MHQSQRSQTVGIPLTIDHVLGYPYSWILLFSFFRNVSLTLVAACIAMASTPFVFDEDDVPSSSTGSSDRGASFLLPSGELDFDAYVAVSPPGGHTGGG